MVMDEEEEEEVVAVASTSTAARWRPGRLVFSSYSPLPASQSLRVVVRKPLVARLSRDIAETYKICNSQFKYSEELNPKRFLTSPSDGVHNEGRDNANSDLILAVNLVLVNSETGRRYVVKDILGHGTFGQVAKCWDAESSSFVAVKIIKNQPAYYQQALVEVSILTTLNKKFDPEDNHHIVRIYDYFVHHRHLCISFEMLSTNLYELIKINNFRGLSLSIVQLFSKQILSALALMKDAGIIHCDLKPENILLCTSVTLAELKVIDFGSACMEDRTVYSYIQSRYYRSPEVLLGYQYTASIDMWSFGCIVAELFLGLPLFPGASEFDLLRRMVKILGGQPPDQLLKEAKNTGKFFKCIRSVHQVENGEVSVAGRSAYQVLTEQEYEARESKPTVGKEYFNHMNLESIVKTYPYRKNLPEEDIFKECQVRLALIDFLRGLVEFDPAKRWSPLQASRHPFVTGEPFTCPYKPPPESPRVLVSQNVKVDHHPGGGHWFAAGLSPNVTNWNIVGVHNSPHLPVVPYGHAHAHVGSYGSLGSHGSYNDGTGLGSSYGSYGENSNMFAYSSPGGMNIQLQGGGGGGSMLGSSPDARRRMMIQLPHGNGLGVSPSAGSFAPMPLGSSPSQFTPPTSSYVGGSPAGHFGPTSPARGTCHGSPLGKVAAASQFNRRKSWGYPPGPGQDTSSSSSPAYWQGHFSDGTCTSTSTSQQQQQQQRGGGGSSYSSSQKNMPGPFALGSAMQFPQSFGASQETQDHTPGEWDPNHSDALFALEIGSEVSMMSNEFSKGMHLNQTLISGEPLGGVGRFNRGGGSNASSIPRSHVEMGSPPSGVVVHDPQHSTYGRPIHHLHHNHHLMPPFSQNSPSRLGQQQQQQQRGRSFTAGRVSEWNQHTPPQPQFSSFSSGGGGGGASHPPPNNSLPHASSSWGRRGGGNVPPTSRSRKDSGKIS